MKALRVSLLTAAYLFASLGFASPSTTIEQKNSNIEKSISKAMSTFQVPGTLNGATTTATHCIKTQKD